MFKVINSRDRIAADGYTMIDRSVVLRSDLSLEERGVYSTICYLINNRAGGNKKGGFTVDELQSLFTNDNNLAFYVKLLEKKGILYHTVENNKYIYHLR